MNVYEYISEDVDKYWQRTEQHLSKIAVLYPEAAKEVLAAQHNLRMIISTINFENGATRMKEE